MKTWRILYAMARADLLERTRRYSFLVMLGLVLFLGYNVNIGQITLRLETYRGVFNSAWVGSMMTLVVNFMLGWFGFYLVKNAVARDYETGVGQIIATTPLSRPLYMLGKWISNMIVLDGMVVILMLAAIVMQLLQREDPHIHLWALSAPFIFVALPFMALVAAMAVLFESIRWLRGSGGNVVYFFFFIMGIAVVAIMFGTNEPLLDWLGFGVFKNSMALAARAAYPAYQGGLVFSLVPPSEEILPFYWAGVEWTAATILPRLVLWGLAVGLTLLAAVFFDRFDATRARPRGKRSAVPAPGEVGLRQEDPVAPATAPSLIRLTSLPVSRPRPGLGALWLAELRLLLKGLPWWWYLAAGGLIVASWVLPLAGVRQTILPAALIWPLLVWSGLGSREVHRNTSQLVFSSPRPLNQLPVAWLAGLALAILMGLGTAVRFALAGELTSLVSLVAGLLFIPSLALMLGVWTGSSKAFEVIYVVFWYLGVLNKVLELDYLGLHTSANWPVYLLLSGLLLGLAILGRWRQLQK